MTTSMTLRADERTSDLADPRCEQRDRAATFAIEIDLREGPDRVLACDICLPDRLRDALLSQPFCPPLVSTVDLDRFRALGVSAA